MAHGDYTGQQKHVLAQRYADEQRLAASSMGMVTATVERGRRETIDLRTHEDRVAETSKTVIDPTTDEAVAVDTQDPLMQPVKFQASATLDQVTIGKDREYNLEEGRVYLAPQWIVMHLDDKGLVRH